MISGALGVSGNAAFALAPKTKSTGNPSYLKFNRDKNIEPVSNSYINHFRYQELASHEWQKSFGIPAQQD